MVDKNTKIGTLCRILLNDPWAKGYKLIIKYTGDGLNGDYFSGEVVESDPALYPTPIGMTTNALLRSRFEIIPIFKEYVPTECQHEYVKYVGFNEVKMICKHCNKDQ